MVINFAVTLVASMVTPAPPQEVQDMVESIRLPDDPDAEDVPPPEIH